MKKKIGIAAAVVGLIDLLVWIVLIFTGAVFDGFGFSGLALFVFILWFVCVAVRYACEQVVCCWCHCNAYNVKLVL